MTRRMSPVKQGKMTLAKAVSTGSDLNVLVALRDRLAMALDEEDVRPRELAELSRLLRETMHAIEVARNRPDVS